MVVVHGGGGGFRSPPLMSLVEVLTRKLKKINEGLSETFTVLIFTYFES